MISFYLLKLDYLDIPLISSCQILICSAYSDTGISFKGQGQQGNNAGLVGHTGISISLRFSYMSPPEHSART